MACANPRILSISSDITVSDSRNRVLEFSGFEVVGNFQGLEALDRFKSEHFDVVIIGDSLPSEVRLQLVRDLKEMKPEVPVVVIHRSGDSGEDVNEADADFESLDGPRRLIEVVSSLIGFSPQAVGQSLRRAASAG
jgi:DNA-binding NtrC family response regulator